jgi:hypothetical protein
VKSLACSVVALLGACDHATPPTPTPADSNATFVAFPATFAEFRAWTSVHDDGPPDDGTYGPDVLGPRTQYINVVPLHGASEFPIGTVIVEARESGAMLIIAAAKRGGGFNADGAVNWEWFGLGEGSDGSVSINWRGIGPPVGGYGALPTSGCNECHQACGANNDFVCSPELQLASF